VETAWPPADPGEDSSASGSGPRNAAALRAIKVVHTVAWAFFASCIFAIPLCAWRGKLPAAAWLIGIVFVECLMLAVNRMRCPLTPLAARYTDDRRDNFDIFLPEWLARHNKLIFGLLYLVGSVYTLVVWARVRQ